MTNPIINPTFSQVSLSGDQEKWTGDTYHVRQENYLAVTISAIATVILTAICIFTAPRNLKDFRIRDISLAVITGYVLAQTLVVIYFKSRPLVGSFHGSINASDEEGKARNIIRIPAEKWSATYLDGGRKKEIIIADYMPSSSASNAVVLESHNGQNGVAYVIQEHLKKKQIDIWEMNTDAGVKREKLQNCSLTFAKQSNQLNVLFNKVVGWSHSFWSSSIVPS